MSFAPEDTTLDGFLDGRLQIRQPRLGYRAATDPVFLAAAVDAKPGQSVLELGCGVGVASLCLGWRVKGLQLTGLEVQADYAELARANGVANDIPITVLAGDLRSCPQPLGQLAFDHVLFNPPYFTDASISTPQSTGKTIAHMEEATIADWVACALRRLKPGGDVSVIHLAERLPDLLTEVSKGAGNIRILPITPRAGRNANRVIVTARKGSGGSAKLLAPFLVHAGKTHVRDGECYTRQSKVVLRDGNRLNCIYDS